MQRSTDMPRKIVAALAAIAALFMVTVGPSPADARGGFGFRGGGWGAPGIALGLVGLGVGLGLAGAYGYYGGYGYPGYYVGYGYPAAYYGYGYPTYYGGYGYNRYGPGGYGYG